MRRGWVGAAPVRTRAQNAVKIILRRTLLLPDCASTNHHAPAFAGARHAVASNEGRASHERPPSPAADPRADPVDADRRSEEHTSELQSLMRISYAVFCLKQNKKT